MSDGVEITSQKQMRNYIQSVVGIDTKAQIVFIFFCFIFNFFSL